jgi:succinate dehydrogenase/fumarate reductase flavoprotein subunit
LGTTSKEECAVADDRSRYGKAGATSTDTSPRQGGEISRRGFLGGTAAGVAAATLPGTLACAPGAEPGLPARWDREADVVVVGSGSGLVAGLAAAVGGAEALVLEKRSVVGGSTGHSGGVAWVPNNTFMRAEGIEDSREKALTYLTHLAQHQADTSLLEAFVDAGPEMAEFVQAHSPLQWRVSKIMGQAAEYHPEWPGAVPRGRSIEPAVDRQGFFGPVLVEGLRKGFEAAGGEILLETPVRRLVVRRDAAGGPEVVGVETERDGAPFFVRARRAVLLAAGGFEWDFEMKRHFLRGPTLYTLGAGGNTGDGVRMAMSVGADLRNMNEVWGITVYKAEAEAVRPNRMGATLNAEIEKRAAGSIVVNRRGQRFQNEAADYDSTWRSYFTWDNWGELGYRNLPAYVLFDAKARRGRTIAGLPADQPLPEWVRTADSLSELADQLGIDAAGLARTVVDFNEHARLGRDPEFRRGESAYDRYGMPDVGITLGPIEEPPFFGAEIAAGDLGTCGGARVNAHAQVLDPYGQVIPRLYAAGNNAGVGSPGSSYGGGGGTIGPAMTFSYIAGRHALSLSPWG